MCGFFTLLGLYSWHLLETVKDINSYDKYHNTLMNISIMYFYFDLFMIFISKLNNLKNRFDLLIHHLLGILFIKLCEYHNYLWIYMGFGMYE